MSRILLLLLALLFIVGVPATAQSTVPDWYTWLYSQGSDQVWMINSLGSVVMQRTLPFSPGWSSPYPSSVFVSPDGARFAYQAGSDQIYIYEPGTDTISAVFSIPSGMSSTHFADYAFDDTGIRLGVGYSDSSTTNWRIEVYDLTTLTVSALTSTDPVVAALGLASGLVPEVQYINGNEVWFTLFGHVGGVNYDSYVWNIVTNSLRRTNNYSTWFNETLRSTHEVILAIKNPSLPLSSNPAPDVPAFSDYQSNALEAYNPTTRTRAPFYHDAELTFSTPRFIENGARIVVGATAPHSERYMLVLGRDGHRFGYWYADGPYIPDYQYRGVPNGFIYLSSQDIYTTLFHVNTTTTLAGDFADNPGGEVPIWRNSGGYHLWIIWTSQGTPDNSRLPAWAQLTAPIAEISDLLVYVPPTNIGEFVNELPTPTSEYVVDVPIDMSEANKGEVSATADNSKGISACSGTLTSRLQIGQLGRVTPGDPNTLRESAGLASKKLGLIPGGDAFKILEGPVCADSHAWFKVDYNGLIGWTAEGDASMYWLEPAG